MISSIKPGAAFFITAFGLAGATSPVFGQETEDELEEIVIPSQDQGDEADVAEEEFEDLVYDEETGSYRLVVDDEGDDWVEGPSEREVAADEIRRLFELYKDALANSQYLEADTLAKRIVELSIRLNGIDSLDSAKAISNLAIVQHRNRDYESAVRNFEASIDIIERVDNRLSSELINPLQGLAATQAATGRPDLAQKTYQRAVHVSHVNEGPHNKDQITILSSMAELYLSLGEFDDATDMEKSIYSIESRNVDPDSIDILPALMTRADWEHRLQRYQRERSTWRRIIDVMEDHYGKDSLELIAPLTNLGKSYLFVSPVEFDYQPQMSSASGESYLRRALKIAENNPEADWKVIEKTMLSLGDYYILAGRSSRAERTYADAWNFLTQDDDPEKLRHRRDNLEKVALLQKVFPPRYYNSERQDTGQPPPENFASGTMSFSYTVSPSGRVEDVVHIETQPRDIEEFSASVGRLLRRQMYRPRIVDGQPVATHEVIYTHEFFYRPSDLPEPEESAEANEAASDTAAQAAADEATDAADVAED
jgi:tetratricopeptide (TPR) repeat protein